MLLEVRELVVRYGPIEVLHGVDLTVGEGEVVTVIGPNGAGKTTLLKTIAGVLRPAAGRITFAGEAIDGRPSHQVVGYGIALIPEGRRIFADQSVRDNLLLGSVGARRRGARGRDAVRARATDLAEALERFPILRERLDHPAGALSGGQQQMLAIARGLMARPRLLLLDEPSLGLAPRLVEQTFASVRRLREVGVSILLVEQLAGPALALADRGYVLERGAMAASGPALALATDPRVMTVYLGRRPER